MLSAAGAGPAQVLVRAVLQVLVLRVGVDRRHEALDDAELVVQGLGHRRQAVRGAGRVRDDRVRLGVVGLVVHAHDDREVLVLGGRGDDDLLGAAVEVRAGLGGVGEEAGRLDHDVGADLAPRQARRVLLGERAEALTAHGDLVGGVRDVAEPAEDRVVLEQVRQGGVVGEVVRPDDLDVGGPREVGRLHGAVEVAADAAEAVDAHADGHCRSPRSTAGSRTRT
jgi:hypothetical protein